MSSTMSTSSLIVTISLLPTFNGPAMPRSIMACVP